MKKFEEDNENTIHKTNSKFQNETESSEENFSENFTLENIVEKNKSMKCGFCDWYPQWLQIFASKKIYTIFHCLIITLSSMNESYSLGTLSTIEKNFKFSANSLGLLKASYELGTLLSNFSLVYFIGKGNKIRWISIFLLIGGISSIVKLTPSLAENNYQNYYNLETQPTDHCYESNENDSNNMIFYIFLIGFFISGISTPVLKTSAVLYLDDNSRKNVFPMLFAIVLAGEGFGSFIGFTMSSFFLKIYVEPNKHPDFYDGDARWIGAWWMGWIPITMIYILCAGILASFPRSLPRAALRRQHTKLLDKNTELSVTDFIASVKRIMTNKIVLLDFLVDIHTKLALAGYALFLPKYFESQFGLTASFSSFSLGLAKLLGKPMTTIVAGFVFCKFKPKPRSMTKWNIIFKFLQILIIISIIFIDCPQQRIEGNWTSDFKLLLTTECNAANNCENIKFSPVCNIEQKSYYYSSCHAGCSPSSYDKDLQTYKNCSCLPDSGLVKKGRCPLDCYLAIVVFLFFTGFLSFAVVPLRYFKRVMRFRYVDEEDRSLLLGLHKFLISLLAMLPSPIIYGTMIDKSCVVFEKTCRKTNYCLVYNLSFWRKAINLFTAGTLIVSLIAEMLVWYYIKDLKLYDEDFENECSNNGKVIN